MFTYYSNLSNYASLYRCCTAAAPCKDRGTVITFGSDVPFAKQVQHDETESQRHGDPALRLRLVKTGSQSSPSVLTFPLSIKSSG